MNPFQFMPLAAYLLHLNAAVSVPAHVCIPSATTCLSATCLLVNGQLGGLPTSISLLTTLHLRSRNSKLETRNSTRAWAAAVR